MINSITPLLDYVLLKEIKPDSGVVTTTDIQDTWQKYEVLKVGPGRFDHGEFIAPEVETGDVVYVQKHAEADTPQELKDEGLALVMASRIMAKETEK